MKYDFSIQDANSLQSTEDYVKIMCGKGKKDDNVLYIKAVEFTYLEGLIWDKYREYGSKDKTKISSSDWSRILAGIYECTERLSTYVETDDLKVILQFNLYRSKSPMNDILDHVKELTELLKAFSSWLEDNLKNEKHLTIVKNKK
jgi:hypothetical protein